jgi:5'(3')-deoxyribonucleotidase
MRIAVDIDNTTLDWQGTWVDAYHQWFDLWVPLDVQNTWNAAIDGTHFDGWDEFWHWFKAAKVWDQMPYVPGAAGALHQLPRLGHQFLFCTARPDHGQRTAVELANAWGTVVDFHNDQSKHLSKADLWIDDSPHAIANLMANGKRVIKLERPWNTEVPAYKSAPDWPAVLEILKEEQ